MQTNGHQERPTTGEPSDVPTGEPPTDQVRLTVAEAARALGITEGAVRSRIKRGTLPVVKESGTVYVLWGDGTPETNHAPYTEAPNDVPSGEPSDQPGQSPSTEDSKLVETLREQIDYLRGQLDQEREAGRRKDHLLARALERIPAAIEPTPEDPATETSPAPPDQPVRGAEEADRGPGQADSSPGSEGVSEPRSWWRRFFGSGV